MGCGSCASGGCGTKEGSAVSGCGSNGTCGTGGCNKMNVFDWLSHMDVPASQKFDVVEVKFKGGRKEYFRNINQVDFVTGDYVVCEMASGQHIGTVSLQGELVRLQMKRKSVAISDDIHVIYRIATEKDLDKHTQAMAREMPTLYRTREIIREMKLNMKLSDVEFQSDNTKTTFYYSSEERVDFRELIKSLASEFKVRIEMRQISLRQEASRLGGLGSCGRELCCSTWLTDFRSVNTSAARYQQLSLNPQKLAGQCGKLKCCLNYELDTYMDALKDFPDYDTKLVTEKGDAICQKQDIFKGLMWFAYTNNFANWHVLKIDQVKEIISENRQKNKVSSLEDFAIEITTEPEKDFNNAMGQESLTRFDQPKKKKKPNRKRKPGDNVAVANAIVPNGNKIQANKPQSPNNNKPSGTPNKPNKQNQPKKANNSNDKKPNEPRKPIIITKNENKN